MQVNATSLEDDANMSRCIGSESTDRTVRREQLIPRDRRAIRVRFRVRVRVRSSLYQGIHVRLLWTASALACCVGMIDRMLAELSQSSPRAPPILVANDAEST